MTRKQRAELNAKRKAHCERRREEWGLLRERLASNPTLSEQLRRLLGIAPSHWRRLLKVAKTPSRRTLHRVGAAMIYIQTLERAAKAKAR